jgi:hypothetical protein
MNLLNHAWISSQITNLLNALTGVNAENEMHRMEEEAAKDFVDEPLPVTDQVLEWAAAISEHPTTFTSFPAEHLQLST